MVNFQQILTFYDHAEEKKTLMHSFSSWFIKFQLPVTGMKTAVCSFFGTMIILAAAVLEV